MQSRIACNTWTLDRTPLIRLVDVALRAGYGAIELRAVDFARSDNVDAAVEAIRKSGLAIPSLGTDGILVQATEMDQANWFMRLDRTSELAVRIGCDTLMVSTGMQNAVDVERAGAILGEAAELVGNAGLRLAYEFNAFHPTIASLPTALAVLARADRCNLGLALDSYHLETSAGFDQLESIDPALLFCVQVSDVPSITTGRAPLDRLVPGQGRIPWTRLFNWLDAAGYSGLISFEAPNPDLWEQPELEVAAAGRSAILKLWDLSRQAGGSTVENGRM